MIPLRKVFERLRKADSTPANAVMQTKTLVLVSLSVPMELTQIHSKQTVRDPRLSKPNKCQITTEFLEDMQLLPEVY